MEIVVILDYLGNTDKKIVHTDAINIYFFNLWLAESLVAEPMEIEGQM